MTIRIRALVPVLVLGGLAAGAPAASAADVSVRKGVVYGSGKVAAPSARNARLRLDLYRPAAKTRTRRPVVVMIHGGGFKMGSRAEPGPVRTARALAARGIVAVSIDYRLRGQSPVPSRRVAPLAAALPRGAFFTAAVAAVDDTLTALSYLDRNAKRLGVDPRRLGLVGSSAGAVTADHVAYALDDHGIKRPKIRFVGSLWGGILARPPQRLGKRGADHLERGEAALFAAHGDQDPTVPVSLSDQLTARAKAKKVRTEYHRIPGGKHGFAGAQFFTRKVRGSQTSLDRLLTFARSELR
jgi:acetyl esterase/lipase